MNEKPKALRLADALEVRGFLGTTAFEAAAELRRLHFENEENQGVIKVWRRRTQQAEAQRDDLLEGFQSFMCWFDKTKKGEATEATSDLAVKILRSRWESREPDVDKMDALRAALEKEQVEEFVAWLRKNSLRFFEAIEPQDDSELPPHTIPPKDEPEGVVCARCGALAFDPIVPQQAEPVADE